MIWNGDGCMKHRIRSYTIISILLIGSLIIYSSGSGLAISTEEFFFNLPDEYETILPDPGTTPDSWFYGMTRVMENIDLFFTFDGKEKAEKLASLAELRLSELQSMVNKGKTEYVDELLLDYSNTLEESTQLLIQINESGENITDELHQMVITTFSQQDLLEHLKEYVPFKAQQILSTALNQTRQSNTQSMDLLSSVQPQVAAEITIRIAQKQFNQVQKNIGNTSMTLDKMFSLVNDSLELISIAQSKQINTTLIEELMTNLTHELLDDDCTLPTELGDEISDLLPSELSQYLNETFDLSEDDIENAIELIHSMSSDFDMNASDIDQLSELILDEEIVQELSNLNLSSLKDSHYLSWIKEL